MPQRLVTGGAGARRLRSGTRGASREQGLHRAEIVLGVHAHGGLVGLDHADGDAVLEQAQLLELLGALEGGGRQRVEALQRGAPIRVHAGVLPVDDVAAVVAVAGDRQAREVERVAAHVGDDLVGGAGGHFLGSGPDLQRRDLHRRVLGEGAHEPLDVTDGHQRLVPLDVHVDIRLVRSRHLPQPVGAGGMVGRRHHRGDVARPARRQHLLGVGGHKEIIQKGRAMGGQVDMRDQREPGDLAEYLPRQPGGGEPRGDDAQHLHARLYSRVVTEQASMASHRSTRPAVLH